jgi:hypothetical protein
MKPGTLIEGIIFLVLGCAGTVEGIRLVNKVDPDSIKDILGPGYYIIILGIILMIIGLVHLVNNRRPEGAPRAKGEAAKTPWVSNPVPLYMLAVFAVYVILIYLFGFLISTLVFFYLEFRIAGVLSWRKNLILTVVAAAVFYIIFIYYCNLVFPVGLFVGRLFA